MWTKYFLLWCLLFTTHCLCDIRHGPDPWDTQVSNSDSAPSNYKVPPDLRMPLKKKDHRSGKSSGVGDWFFLRLLTIILKGGKVQEEDYSVDITLQMNVPRDRWELLHEYMGNPDGLSEEMLRRVIGYVEDAIYKPSVTEKLVMAWTEYIHVYLVEYKTFITLGLGMTAAMMLLVYLVQRISRTQLYLLLFAILYLYESFLSYKETEHAEYERYMSALAACQWRFWSAACAAPAPEPALLLRHLHPLRVALRLATALVAEPLLTVSAAVNEIVLGVSDTFWYPVNKIVYCCLLIGVNMLLVMFLIMILFNFLLNIPFNVSFFAGLVNVGVRHRNRNIPTLPVQNDLPDNGDRISGANLDRLLSFLERSVVAESPVPRAAVGYRPAIGPSVPLRRSASAGRLTELGGAGAAGARARGPRADGSGDH